MVDLGREVLPENDGWGSFGPGVTGGSVAAPDQVYTVTNRRELIAALNDGIYPPPSSNPSNTPKIIYVSGAIDANVDDNNHPLTCEDYYRDGFTWEPSWRPTTRPSGAGSPRAARWKTPGWLPATPSRRACGSAWAITPPSSDLAKMRRSAAPGSTCAAAAAAVSEIRARTSSSATSPSKTPTTASRPGRPPMARWAPGTRDYDAISLRDTDHVWIDHNTFRGPGDTSDSWAPNYFGVLLPAARRAAGHHQRLGPGDGLVEPLRNHDKVMLIGSSRQHAPLTRAGCG